MDEFSILYHTSSTDAKHINAAEMHLKELSRIKNKSCETGSLYFIEKWINVFKKTGSPIVINLDHNISASEKFEKFLLEKEDKNTAQYLPEIAKGVTKELHGIVKSTAGYVSGYKMNEQSMLSFLIAGEVDFVPKIKREYSEICEDKFGIPAEPVVWTDEKLRDIPSTTYQTASIIYSLGYDAIHCMPQLGPDIPGALQLASKRFNNKGTIHVINMTHDGYKTAKKDYFNESTMETLRKNAIGMGDFAKIYIDEKAGETVKVKADGIIEPANRPYELFNSKKSYDDNTMIISIGIGPQGALPGSALYAGASLEGIGRFIFSSNGKYDGKNIEKKAKACRDSALLALDAKSSLRPYPLGEIMDLLKEYNPKIREDTRKDLELIYDERLKTGV